METKREMLRDYLESLSPDCPIKVYYEPEDSRIIFDGDCGTVLENNYFENFEVTGHAFRDGEMLIWTK